MHRWQRCAFGDASGPEVGRCPVRPRFPDRTGTPPLAKGPLNRRRGVVLDVPANLTGTLNPSQATHQVQGHVYPRRDARRRHEVAVVDEPRVWVDQGAGIQLRELAQRPSVGGGRAIA
jgi:hypothetical protein